MFRIFGRLTALLSCSRPPAVIKCPRNPEGVKRLQKLYRDYTKPGNPFQSPKMQADKISGANIIRVVLLEGEVEFHTLRISLERKLGFSFEIAEYSDAWMRVAEATKSYES